MEMILCICLIASIIRGQAYKVSLKTIGIYLQKKGYNQPTDSELKECSLIAFRQMFKVGAR